MIEKNQENEMHWQAFVLFLKEIFNNFICVCKNKDYTCSNN